MMRTIKVFHYNPVRYGALWVLLFVLFADRAESTLAEQNGPYIRSFVSVTGNHVTLGDIFEGAGDVASVIVAQSPPPGMKTALSIPKISYLARKNGLKWRNRSGLSNITIARTGDPVDPLAIEDALRNALLEKFPPLSAQNVLQIELDSANASLVVPQGQTPSVSVERFALEARTGRFKAVVRAPANAPDAPLRRLAGRAWPARDIPVLAEQKRAGEPIHARDIDWIRLPLTRIGQNMITDQKQLTGMTPRRTIRPGSPIRVSDVETPVIVRKNTLVLVVLNKGPMTLSTKARALEDGALGDMITVRNMRSRQIIQAVVTAPGEARIELTGF